MKSKTKALTPEEKLSQTLLPREEWPYELPKGWVWTRVGTCVKVSKEKTENFRNPLLKYVGLENFESNRGIISFSSASDVKSTKNVFHSGQILYGKLRPYLNKHDIVDFEGICSTDILVIDTLNICISSYFNSYLDLDQFIAYAVQNSKGINLPRVNENTIMQAAFPLPPLPEQQRIVDKIESLFAKLDEAGDRLQKVLDGYEARRAAILHEAFSGKWTGDSGEQSDIKRMPLKKCGVWHGGGTPSKSHPEYWANGSIMWITSKDMKTDVIENSLICVNEKGIENSSAVYSDKPAVLFVMRSGVLRHTLPIAMVSKPYTVNQDLKALTPEEGILPEYVMWACKAEEKTILNQCMKSGTTVESINFQSLLHFQIPVYPEKKQRYIVDRIHKALTSEESSFNHISSVYTQIDLMKKSILARAFRGELGTQDPSDPSALELLKECVMAGKEDSQS